MKKTIEIEIDLTTIDIKNYINDAIEYHSGFDEFDKMTKIIEVICKEELRYEDGIDMIEDYFKKVISQARSNC